MSVPLAYIAVVIIWSTTPLALKWSGEDLGVLFAANARMAIGLLACLLLLLVWRQALRWDMPAIKAYMAIGLGVLFAMLFAYLGSQYVPSGMIAVIFGLTPIFTGLFATLLIPGHKLWRYQFFAMLFGIAGLVVIFYDQLALENVEGLIGVGFMLTGTILHGLSTVLSKKYAGSVTALAGTTGALLLSVPVYTVLWLAYGQPFDAEQLGSRAGITIVYLGVVGSAAGFMLYIYALKNIDAMKMALIPLITPVFALFIGAYFNNEQPGIALIAGGLLILSGLVLFQWGHRISISGILTKIRVWSAG